MCILSCATLAIGIWEATVASSNSPTKIKLDDHNHEMYALTVTKCVCNIIIGLISAIMGLCNVIFAKETDNKSKDDKSSNGSTLQTVNFGVSIWALVRYFNRSYYHSLLTPYQHVLTVEMISFFVSLGIFGTFILTIVGICCINCCCSDCLQQKKNQNNDKDKNGTQMTSFDVVIKSDLNNKI